MVSLQCLKEPSNGNKFYIYCLSLRIITHLLPVLITTCPALVYVAIHWNRDYIYLYVLCYILSLGSLLEIYTANYGNWLFLAVMLT